MSRLHVFGDEAGDLVFKTPGNGVSRYFMIGTITLEDCSVGEKFLALRRELAWEGTLLDQLHATSDRQHVRDRAFGLIAATDLRFDATILDKRKAQDDLRRDPFYFYKLAWYLHFKYVASKIASPNDELLVVASSLQIKRKRKSTKAGVHEAITEVVNQVSPTVTCHCAFSPAATDPCLQVADYLTWAIQRKYESGDTRSYDLVQHLVESEFEPFKRGTRLYY
jgi:hypothetical protein